MKKIMLSSLGIFLLFFISLNAQAEIVVFDQLPHSTAGALTSSPCPDILFNTPAAQVYDDFTIDSSYSSYSITRIDWWGFYYPSYSSAYEFALTYYDYSGDENGGAPPSTGKSIGYSSLSATASDSIPGVYLYSAVLTTPLNLDPNTYWLSIYSKDTNTWWGWQRADYPEYDYSGTYGGSIQTGQSGIQSNVAFQLISESPVPIPPAAWLLGSGMIALVVIRRRTRSR